MCYKNKKILELISDFKDLLLCAGQDLNLHPIKLGYAPQTYASTSSATSASVFLFLTGQSYDTFFNLPNFFAIFFKIFLHFSLNPLASVQKIDHAGFFYLLAGGCLVGDVVDVGVAVTEF